MSRTLLALVGGLLLLPALGSGQEKSKASPQKEQSFAKEIQKSVKLNYLLFLPEGYEKAEKPWPLMMFLHGAGESGSNLANVKKHGPPKIVESKPDFPFVLVSPQAPKFGWDPEALNALLEDILAKYKVDSDRVYLTGLSMGGMGTWALACRHPEKFAAIVPICGGGSPIEARRLRNLPAWVFHGAKDTTVLPEYSDMMVKAMEKSGGKVKYTVYPDAGHDSWTKTYDNPELYEWLLKQKRGAKRN